MPFPFATKLHCHIYYTAQSVIIIITYHHSYYYYYDGNSSLERGGGVPLGFNWVLLLNINQLGCLAWEFDLRGEKTCKSLLFLLGRVGSLEGVSTLRVGGDID